MDLLYAAAQAVYDFMEASPSLLTMFACFALVGLPLVAIHELGHALVAAARLGDAEVTVGNAAKIASARLGQIDVTVNAFTRPDRVAGVAVFDDTRATARDVLLIALAGPGASLGAWLVTLLVYGAAPAEGLMHDLAWSAALLAGGFVVINLIPMSLEERRGESPMRSDGRLALDALKALRAI